MVRRLRVQYPGAIYHVMARGNGRQDIVRDDADRDRLQQEFGRAAVRCSWSVYAFVILSNHLHVVLKTPQPDLARGMEGFLSAYTNAWARRYRFCGHVFQGRYRTELLEDETYLDSHITHPGREAAGVARGSSGGIFDFLTDLFHGLPGLLGDLAGPVRDGLRRRFDRGARALHHRLCGLAGRLGRGLGRIGRRCGRMADSTGSFLHRRFRSTRGGVDVLFNLFNLALDVRHC
jgi:REP element-mobilizing transposase RayT